MAEAKSSTLDFCKSLDVYVMNRNNHPQPENTTLINCDRLNIGDRLKDYSFDAVLDITAYTKTDIQSLTNSLIEFSLDYMPHSTTQGDILKTAALIDATGIDINALVQYMTIEGTYSVFRKAIYELFTKHELKQLNVESFKKKKRNPLIQ